MWGEFVIQAINPYYDGVPPSPQIKPMIWIKMGTAIQMGETNDSFKALKLAVLGSDPNSASHLHIM